MFYAGNKRCRIVFYDDTVESAETEADVVSYCMMHAQLDVERAETEADVVSY